MTDEELQRVISVTQKAHHYGLTIEMVNGSFNEMDNKWDIESSIYFASTVISTIGQ